MITSAIRKISRLKEIVVTEIDAVQNYENIYTQNGITIKKLGYDVLKNHVSLADYYIFKNISTEKAPEKAPIVENSNAIIESSNAITAMFGHALGLHHCINNSTQEYILFCDPDVIFLNKVDDIYLKFMDKYDLQYIGCAHESANKVACFNFPYLANSLIKRCNLPSDDFLLGELYFHGMLRYPVKWEPLNDSLVANGKWLIRGILQQHYDKFPNPDLQTTEGRGKVDFDTGSNLYLWNLKNNWNWLSFLTPDCHHYKTSFYRSNLPIKDKFKPATLIYHQFGRYRNFEEFMKIHSNSLEE